LTKNIQKAPFFRFCCYDLTPKLLFNVYIVWLIFNEVALMSETVRLDVVERKPQARLEKAVECDEVYIVAGHKGIPKAIKNRDPRRNRLKGARGRGTLETEKSPIFRMIQRDLTG
jgi:hypothetical protein